MACGDSETILSELVEILKDIETVCSDSENKVANKVLVSIKNTMSDRHIVQKKFNRLLEEYRAEVLPDVIDQWYKFINVIRIKLKKLINRKKTNSLSMNETKTDLVIFRSPMENLPTNFSIKINKFKLKPVDVVKCLGLYIDETLSWNNHIIFYVINCQEQMELLVN